MYRRAPRSRCLGVGFAIVCLAGLSQAGLPSRLSAAEPDRPNIVFILVDDLRYNALGATGHPFVKTPNIDRIAREGANFRRAFVTTPLCSPSRASFLTGRYVHAHGVIDNTNHSPRSHTLVTFPRLLHEAGYETAFIGKWHMGNDDSPRPGFDRWVSFKGQGQYIDPQINEDGQSRKAEGYITDILNEHAVEFVRKAHTKPYALYLSHKAIHGPFTPAERHRTLYENEPIEPTPSANDDLSGKPMLTRKIEGVAIPKAKAQAKNKTQAKAKTKGQGGNGQNLIRSQLRCLQSIEEGVGQIIQALEAAGALDRTLLVFTSDNGYLWSDHGLGDKRAAYEPSIRIPLLMRYPKRIKPGTVIDAPALNIDMAPTFLEAAGVPVPADVHGVSLWPVLADPSASTRPAFLTEYFAEKAYPRIASWQAVSDDRFKYIHYTDLEGMDELYDLQADPNELKNLINDPAHQARLTTLKVQLARLLKASDAPAAK